MEVKEEGTVRKEGIEMREGRTRDKESDEEEKYESKP